MPGIVGLITAMPKEQAESRLCTMLAAMSREPAYASGIWSDAASGVYVGWTVRRGAFACGMPLLNETGSAALVFSGEEFPEPDTVRELRMRGHSVNPGADYLVHRFEDDPAFFASLNGRFHGLAVDRRARRATLFNDRYGIHRLYYHLADGALYFSAEAKAILAACPEQRSPDPQGLAELVGCGCVLGNRTLFKDVGVLPPASAWTFDRGTLDDKAAYFEPREWEEQAPLEPEAYYRALRETFARNLPRYFGGDEPVAMSLTGGLDTRMIMAWQKSPPGSLPCYSFGSMYRDPQDVRVAREVARVCRQPHSVITLGKDFLSRFPDYARRTVYKTDGCVDVGHAPDLYANEAAAAIAPVRMTGNYGGEILRRVRAFKPVEPAQDLFNDEFLRLVRATRTTYGEVVAVNPLSFAAFRQTPWHHFGLLALEQTQLSVRTPYLDNDFVKTVFRAPEAVLGDNVVCLRLIEDGAPALVRIPTDRGLASGRPPAIEAVARAYQEFTFKAEYAYGRGMPQWLARLDHIASPLHLERLFVGRHKFYHFRQWYRDELSEFIQDMLLDPQTLSRPYLRRATVEAMVNGHVRGDRNYTNAIHTVLTLELIHRLFIDSHAGEAA